MKLSLSLALDVLALAASTTFQHVWMCLDTTWLPYGWIECRRMCFVIGFALFRVAHSCALCAPYYIRVVRFFGKSSLRTGLQSYSNSVAISNWDLCWILHKLSAGRRIRRCEHTFMKRHRWRIYRALNVSVLAWIVRWLDGIHQRADRTAAH